jgi:hypothetical protein
MLLLKQLSNSMGSGARRVCLWVSVACICFLLSTTQHLINQASVDAAESGVPQLRDVRVPPPGESPQQQPEYTHADQRVRSRAGAAVLSAATVRYVDSVTSLQIDTADEEGSADAMYELATTLLNSYMKLKGKARAEKAAATKKVKREEKIAAAAKVRLCMYCMPPIFNADTHRLCTSGSQ